MLEIRVQIPNIPCITLYPRKMLSCEPDSSFIVFFKGEYLWEDNLDLMFDSLQSLHTSSALKIYRFCTVRDYEYMSSALEVWKLFVHVQFSTRIV